VRIASKKNKLVWREDRATIEEEKTIGNEKDNEENRLIPLIVEALDKN
jgi:hypothetical protein